MDAEGYSQRQSSSEPSLPTYVLDSFALIAFFEGEESAEVVQEILEKADKEEAKAMISLIDLGEVAYITEREQGLGGAQAMLSAVQQLPLQILPVDQDAVFAAAHIKANHQISFADAFAAAAARTFDGTLLTGDSEFQSVGESIRIQWLSR